MATNQFGAPCTANLGGVVDYYSKAEINNLLSAKPNTSTVYTRSVLDARFESLSELVASLSASQIDETRLLSYLEQTKEEILSDSEATYAKISSIYTQQEVDALISGVDLDPSSVVRTLPGSTGENTIYPGANNAVALTVRGSSVNPTVTQWLNAAGESLAKINANGSVYIERDLNLGLSMPDGSSALKLSGKRLSELADPVNERDAVPFSYLKSYILDYYAEISRPDLETFYTVNAGEYDSSPLLRDSYRHVRSSVFSKRPLPADLLDGEISVNYNTLSPGLFIKDSLGKVRKIGPAYVGTSSPSPSNYTSLSDGEMWIDKSGFIPILRYYDESSDSWIGTGVEISVNDAGGDGSLEYDQATGTLTYTGPGPEEVRSHFTAGQGISIEEGLISIDSVTEFDVDSFNVLSGLNFKSGEFISTLTTQVLTEDRLIRLPNASGTLISTGTLGLITSSMIANGTIVDEDISVNAQISDTKLGLISEQNKVNVSAIDLDGAEVILDSLADGDLILVDKGGVGLNFRASLSDLYPYVFSKISGDVTIDESGGSSITPGSIINSDINTSAGISVSKLAKGTANQLLQTNSAGTTVAWVSDVTVPGTLDVNDNLSIRSQKSLRLYDSDNSNWLGFKSPSNVNISTTWTLPPQDGQPGQVIGTDGFGNLAFTDSGNAGGNAGELQINDGQSPAGLGAVTGLKWDLVNSELDVPGDINLDDGGAFATTLQLITPTANRTISFPDATGTVGLVAGSSGQFIYNNAGAYAGAPSTSVGASGDITLSLAGAASTPPVSLTGTWFSGGTATTTKPQFLIEPAGTTSTAWTTSGTGLGVNASSGFAGNLLDLQVNGSSKFAVNKDGNLYVASTLFSFSGPDVAYQIAGIVSARFLGINGSLFRGKIAVAVGNPINSQAGFYITVVSEGLANFENSTGSTGYFRQVPVSVSALPAAATVGAGTRGFVSDSTVAASGNFGATVTGGGSNNVPVFSDGTNWLIG